MISDTLKSQLIDVAKQCYEQAEIVLGKSFEFPTILFNQRGKIAGCALLQKNTLKFHPLLLEQNQAHFLTHVVPHEIAHLIVWQIYGKVAPHGREWQHIMINVFNLPPHRTHQYNVDNIGIKTVPYACLCGEVAMTIRRHNKVLKGTIYRCKHCGENLQQQP